MRDQIKTKEYFEAFIDKRKQEIKEDEEWIEKCSAEDPNDPRISTIRSTLARVHLELIRGLYSYGEDVEKIYPYFLKYIKYESYDFEDRESGMTVGLYNLWDILSWAVIFADRKEDFIEHIELIVRNSIICKEEMAVVFANYLGVEVEFKGKVKDSLSYYKVFRESEDKQEGLKLAMKKWYAGSRGNWWFGLHKREDEDLMYEGYWAVDIAALAIVYDLDDEELKNTKYYPYDLVHYKD